MPKMTSAQAAKELKRLNDLHTALLEKEQKAAVFTAAIQEDIEQAHPEYDYAGTQVILRTFESRIIRLKHSINVFNTTYVIPEFNKTVKGYVLTDLKPVKKVTDNHSYPA